MSDFLDHCDSCGNFLEVRWVFDRYQNEDRVACADCRLSRDMDPIKLKEEIIKEPVPTPRRGGWAEQ